MKFSCYKQDLIDALKLVVKSVALKPQTPILGSIFINADNSSVELQSSDNKTTTLAKIPAHVEQSGKATVTGKLFADVIAKLPDDTVTCTVDTSFVISSGAAKFELLIFNPDDFPTSKPVGGATFHFTAKSFKNAIKKVASAAGKDDMRPIFNGVLFEFADGFFKATATNTHRLNHIAIPQPVNHAPLTANIPADVLKNIVNALPDDETQITASFADRKAQFAFHNFIVQTRLIYGEYPPYQKVLDVAKDFSVTVNTAELKNAVNRVSVIAKDSEFKSVSLTFESDAINVSADNEQSSASELVEIQDGKEGFQIAFNINYLLDLLGVIDKPTITISFYDKFSPALFEPVGDDEFVAIVTPIRTR